MEYLKKSLKDSEVEKQWMKIRNTFRFEYSNLTGIDLDYRKGDFGHMIRHISRKLGLTESQLRRKILRWEDSASHYF